MRWLIVALTLAIAAGGVALAFPEYKRSEWPNTDFSKASVSLDEIMSGGPPRDGIPPIDNPKFLPVSEATGLADTEPVIGLVIGGEAKAYPLRILIWHEIANDTVGGVPVAVTFCPLCNAAMVFDRRVDAGCWISAPRACCAIPTSIMYDRQTESWWQQFLGEAIVGELTGTVLKVLPSRLESWAQFPRARTRGTGPGAQQSEHARLWQQSLCRLRRQRPPVPVQRRIAGRRGAAVARGVAGRPVAGLEPGPCETRSARSHWMTASS